LAGAEDTAIIMKKLTLIATIATITAVSIVFLISTAGETRAAGNTYYVAVNGNDGNSCSQAQNSSSAKKSINADLGCLSAGDALIVKVGTYVEWIDQAIPSGISTG
jgi:hypothetical protein